METGEGGPIRLDDLDVYNIDKGYRNVAGPGAHLSNGQLQFNRTAQRMMGMEREQHWWKVALPRGGGINKMYLLRLEKHEEGARRNTGEGVSYLSIGSLIRAVNAPDFPDYKITPAQIEGVACAFCLDRIAHTSELFGEHSFEYQRVYEADRLLDRGER